MAVFYVCDPKIRPSTNLTTSAQNQFPNKLLGEHGFVAYTIQLTMNSNVIVYLIPPTHKSQVQIFFFFTNFGFLDRKTKDQKGKPVSTPPPQKDS